MDSSLLKSVKAALAGVEDGRGERSTTAFSAKSLLARSSSLKAISTSLRKKSAPSLEVVTAGRETKKRRKRCHILSLPPEIIQHIATLLRRPTAACFTFTCKRILEILGTQYWDTFQQDLRHRELIIQHWSKNPLYENLPSSAPAVVEGSPGIKFHYSWSELSAYTAQTNEKRCHESTCGCFQNWKTKKKEDFLLRRQLLQLLARDVPDMIRCGRCVMLHRPGRRVPAVNDSDLRECEASDERMEVDRVLYKGFTFTHIQQAMKFYHMGHSDTRSYVKSLSSSITTHFNDPQLPQVNQNNLKFRIIAHEIYVRAQYWILFPSSTSPIFQPQDLLPSHDICRHLSFGDAKRNRLAPSLVAQHVLLEDGHKKLDDVLRCRMTHRSWEVELCGTCSGVHQCLKCETEFQIDVKDMGHGRGSAVVVTKWCNLGAGDMWQDPKWMRHLQRDPVALGRKSRWAETYSEREVRRAEELKTRPRWRAGAIRDVFQGGRRDFRFESCLEPGMEEELRREVQKLRVLRERERDAARVEMRRARSRDLAGRDLIKVKGVKRLLARERA